MNKYLLNSIYRDIFALLAGGLFTLAFAPFNYSLLALVALTVLFATWQHCSPARALLRGYLFGLGSFGLGISWVYISVHDYGGAAVFGSVAITVLCVAFWAIFPAITAWLSVKLQGHKSIEPLTLPLIWVLVEYFRGDLLLNGFPWFVSSYSQLSTTLAGYVPLIGAYGSSFLLVLSASLAMHMLRNKPQRLLMAASIGLIWSVGGLLKLTDWTDVIGKPIHTVLVQGNVTQDQKWRPENRLNTLLMYKKMTEENWGADVIVWPETAIPAYLSQVDEFFLQPLKQKALQHNTDLIVSLPTEGETENEIYNAVITLGKHKGMYRKNHLLPFGEYMPLQPLSGLVLKGLNIRMGDFTRGGDSQDLLKAGGYPFITTICYEDAFGDAGLYKLEDAAYLVNVTNDGWFGDSFEPYQHLQIARMRAIETGRYMLRATNTGATAVINPKGEIIALAPLFTTTTLKAEILPMGGITPYAQLGDGKVMLLLLATLMALLIYKYYKAQLFRESLNKASDRLRPNGN